MENNPHENLFFDIGEFFLRVSFVTAKKLLISDVVGACCRFFREKKGSMIRPQVTTLIEITNVSP